MSLRGFKGFRRPETVTDETLETALGRLNLENRFIYWTGEGYKNRRESLRSNSLKALKVSKEPVALADWIRLAARVVDETTGYNPASVRAGLYLHHDSKPAVYYELKKDDKGNYVAVNNYPYAEPSPIKAGDVIIAAPEEVVPTKIAVAGKDLVATPESAAKNVARRARNAARKGKPAKTA